MNRPIQFIRLASDARENGLHCDAGGLALAGRPLLKRAGATFVPQSVGELQSAFDAAYGENSGMQAEAYVQGLASVARFLNKGDVPLAMIGSLMLRLPEVSDSIDTSKSAPNSLTKAGYNDSQLRDERGRWSLEGGDETPEPPFANDNVEPPPVVGEEAPAFAEEAGTTALRAAPKLLRALGTRALGLLGGLIEIAGSPVTLTAGVVLTPTNESNMKSGAIPGAPGLTYSCDEGVVSVLQLDAAGNAHAAYHGFPDKDGFYYDKQGLIIGRQAGKGAVFDPEALIEMAADTTDAQGPKAGVALLPGISLTPEDDEPKVCPPETKEDITDRSARSLKYQQQITGLPIGWDMLFNGVRFDGCDQLTKRMLEAKGLMGGYLQFFPVDKLGETPFFIRTMRQAGRQNIAAAGRGVDWYFADKKFADFFEKEFRAAGYFNIRVYHEEAAVKKIEDCIAFIRKQLDAWRLIEKELSFFWLSPIDERRI